MAKKDAFEALIDEMFGDGVEDTDEAGSLKELLESIFLGGGLSSEDPFQHMFGGRFGANNMEEAKEFLEKLKELRCECEHRACGACPDFWKIKRCGFERAKRFQAAEEKNLPELEQAYKAKVQSEEETLSLTKKVLSSPEVIGLLGGIIGAGFRIAIQEMMKDPEMKKQILPLFPSREDRVQDQVRAMRLFQQENEARKCASRLDFRFAVWRSRIGYHFKRWFGRKVFSITEYFNGVFSPELDHLFASLMVQQGATEFDESKSIRMPFVITNIRFKGWKLRRKVLGQSGLKKEFAKAVAEKQFLHEAMARLLTGKGTPEDEKSISKLATREIIKLKEEESRKLWESVLLKAYAREDMTPWEFKIFCEIPSDEEMKILNQWIADNKIHFGNEKPVTSDESPASSVEQPPTQVPPEETETVDIPNDESTHPTDVSTEKVHHPVES